MATVSVYCSVTIDSDQHHFGSTRRHFLNYLQCVFESECQAANVQLVLQLSVVEAHQKCQAAQWKQALAKCAVGLL